MKKTNYSFMNCHKDVFFLFEGSTSNFLHLFDLGSQNNQTLGNNTIAKWKFARQSKQSDGCVDWICKGLSRSFQDAVGFGILKRCARLNHQRVTTKLWSESFGNLLCCWISKVVETSKAVYLASLSYYLRTQGKQLLSFVEMLNIL